MPRKKKVVNEDINLAPKEQDLSVNKIESKEEIKVTEVATQANKSPRKSPKRKKEATNETKVDNKSDQEVGKVDAKKDNQPKTNVIQKVENKDYQVSEPKNMNPDSNSNKTSIDYAKSDEGKQEITSKDNNSSKKFNRNKKKQKSKNTLEDNNKVSSQVDQEVNEKTIISKVEDKTKANLISQEPAVTKIVEPNNLLDKSDSENSTIIKDVTNPDAKPEGKRFNKWKNKKKFNREKLEIKQAESEEINQISNADITEQINQVLDKSLVEDSTIETTGSELVKTEEIKEELVEVKQEERKKSKNKKKKKNKKDRVENPIATDNLESKDQVQPQQVEKKPEPPKVIKKPEPEIVITINPKKMLTKEQEKNPFLIKFFAQLEDFLRKEVQIEKGQKLLVAMSGGVDSSVLFDALSIMSFKMKFIIYVLHFNHKLRGLSSERDEKLVNQLSKDYNVQYFNASGNVKQFAERNSLSIEYAARQLRYNFFEKVARTMNANFVATAHTADDNVETFFLNLFRGSGLTGLSGIPAKRNLVKNVMMLRPLIKFRKKELLEYAKIRRLKWFEDETNSLLNYTRNKIRLSLIPRLEEEFNPSITDIINQTTRLMSGADRLIRDMVKKNYPLVVEEASQEKFTIKLPMLMANEEFIQGEIIQYLWLKYFRLQPLPMQTINRILSLNNSQTGAVCEINSMYFVLKDRNNLIFTKRQYEENIKLLVSIPGKYFIGRYKIEFTEVDRSEVVLDDNPNIEYFDSSIMESFLEIRNWQMGDTFQPLGMKGEMKVSDFLINEKVPITEKASVIVLTNKTDIIWIIGKRISDKFKIKKNAEKVIKAVIIKNEKK